MKKSSLMCAPLIALVVAVGLGANSQALADIGNKEAKQILSQNPNLKSVTEIPVNLEVRNGGACQHFNELDLRGGGG